jgi:hypothetical protein
MVDTTIEIELSTCMGRLPVNKQREVLDFARTLAASPLQGVRGADLLRFAGTIDKSDVDAMSQAIKDGCEGIDADEW